MNTYAGAAILFVAITIIPNTNATTQKTQLEELVFQQYTEAWFQFRKILETDDGFEWARRWNTVENIKMLFSGNDYILGSVKLNELGSPTSNLIRIYRTNDPAINEKGIAREYRLNTIQLPKTIDVDSIKEFAYRQGKAEFGEAYDEDRFCYAYKPFSGPTLAANGKNVDKSAPPCDYMFFIMGIADA